MSKQLYITASAVINKNVIYKDEQIIFINKNINTTGFLLDAYQHFNINYPKFYKMDNLCKLGLLATEVLLKDSFYREKYKPEEIGVILANANASLDTDIKYFETTKEIASPALFVYTLPNIVVGEICIRNNFKGENAFFIFDKFNIDFIQQYVNSLINNNILQACICGWVDLLDEEYKAVLFLVEKRESKKLISFNKETIFKLYQLTNG